MAETLYLIDGHAQIFRAYYAIRGGMRSPITGEPTHAVFGFAGMLLKLLSQFRPHYVVVATDYEAAVSRNRRKVQDVMDACTAEIARRYQSGEASVDDLLADR
jgi:hypothetical protein